MRLFKDDVASGKVNVASLKRRRCILLQTTYHPCVSGCCRYLASGDGHDRCLMCLVTFVDESCSHCGKMTILELRIKLRYLKRGGAPLPLPRSSSRHGGSQAGATSGSSMGGQRVTVMANPRGNQLSGDHRSSCTPQPVELPKERTSSILRRSSQRSDVDRCIGG